MNCSECGERLTDGAPFCSACGRRVAQDAPPSSVLEPPRMPRTRAAPPARARAGFEPTTRRIDTEAPQRAPRTAAAGEGLSGFSGVMRTIGPHGMVGLGVLVALAAYGSAMRDDTNAKAAAERRMSFATEPLPAKAQKAAPHDGAFPTREALQGLYGSYDGQLDGVFWTVSGAPREWGEWNGKPVVIRPLVSRTDDSGTRHVLVTNSVEVRDGLVVREGGACRSCKSLVGAALFERRGEIWALVTEHRFMKIGGAYGAPPKVTVDFPRDAGVEIRMENPPAEPDRTRNSVHAVILHGGKPASAPVAAR